MRLTNANGIVVALGAVAGSVVVGGSDPAILVSPAALVLVLLGTFGICLAGVRMQDLGGIARATLRCMRPARKLDSSGTVADLMSFADVSRRDGLVALAAQASAMDDPFLRRGLDMVVAGTDSKTVADTLHAEISCLRSRHQVAASWYADAARFAPTLGVIGTILAVLQVLQGVADPSGLVPAIGAAFVPTAWGLLSARLLWQPMAERLTRLSATEVAHRQLLVQGILAIQDGAPSGAVGERLRNHVVSRPADTTIERQAA